MKVPFADLYAQYRSIQSAIDGAIASVIRDTAFIGGSVVKQFEADFAAHMDMPYCIACGNGTDSLEILLNAYEIGPGDEVIVPAHSWISTAECVSNVGATPVFADTDPQTYTIDPAAIEALITPRTRAIIPVHLYGLPAEMDPIMELAARHDLVVIEDCAQAHDALYRGRKVGTIGHASSFSFYPGKNLGAYGDAGGMLTRDEAIATRARMIANHGQLTKHDHRIPGRNSRLDGMQAAILSAKLPYLAGWTAARQAHAATYETLLRGSGIQLPTVPAHMSHVYHLYVVQVPARDQVKQTLQQAGIETAIHYPTPLPLLPAYAQLGYHDVQLPVAAGYHSRILSLPMYPEMTGEMIAHVCTTLIQSIHVTA
jgi:dTDP-4-amino-4,6-dideoxygalactose transaminase